MNTGNQSFPNLSDIVLKQLPVSIFWKDKNGVYIGCNEHMAYLAGLESAEQVIGKTDYDMPWKNEADSLRAIDQEVIATGKSVTLEEVGRLANGELTTFLTTKDLLVDDDKNIIGIYGVSVDITERKKLEQELQQAREDAERAVKEKARLLVVANKKTDDALANLQSIVSSMPGNVYWKDLNGVYRGCNDVIVKMSGLKSREEFIGKTDFDFAELLGWSPEVAETFHKIDQEVISTGKSVLNIEEPPFQTADGELIYQLDNKSPLLDADRNIAGVIGIGIDITERKLLEMKLEKALKAAEASDHAKSEFIQNMSHDVKTPLAGITSMADRIGRQLEEPEDLEDNYENVQMIKNSVRELIEFFMNCLEMVRIETGEVALSNENFNPQTIMDQLVEIFTPSMKQKGLGFNVTYDHNIPEMVYASAPGFYRIILNLLGNAIKFTEEGSIGVDILLQKTRDEDSGKDKEELCLKIRDTGMGIPQEKIATIFDRFTRLTPSYEGKFEGHGIGLYIVHKFVTLMGGKIDVSSELGKGSCFTITFPFLPAKAFLKPRAVKPKFTKLAPLGDASSEGEETGPRILLVEDNRMAQKGVESILTHLGYKLDIVDTGKKALDIFELDKYVLIITDIGLDDMSGTTVAAHIRTVEKGRKNRVPIVALTAHNVEKVQAACTAAGINGVLEKPLTEEVAREVLDCFVQK